jgi:hypothetical protein
MFIMQIEIHIQEPWLKFYSGNCSGIQAYKEKDKCGCEKSANVKNSYPDNRLIPPDMEY